MVKMQHAVLQHAAGPGDGNRRYRHRLIRTCFCRLRLHTTSGGFLKYMMFFVHDCVRIFFAALLLLMTQYLPLSTICRYRFKNHLYTQRLGLSYVAVLLTWLSRTGINNQPTRVLEIFDGLCTHDCVRLILLLMTQHLPIYNTCRYPFKNHLSLGFTLCTLCTV